MVNYALCVDTSPMCEHVFSTVLRLLHDDHSNPDRITLLTVVDPGKYSARHDWDQRQLHQHCYNEGMSITALYERKVKDSGKRSVIVESVILEGTEAGQSICSYLNDEKNGIDIVAMGKRNQGAISKLFLGSVSEYVVKNSLRPTLVVPFKGINKTSSSSSSSSS